MGVIRRIAGGVRGRSLSAAAAAPAISNPEDAFWQLGACAGPARPAMQTVEVGPVPTPTREPRLTRWLRRGSGILAHLVALGFTIFLTVLSRPGTSECTGRGGAREGGGAEMLEGQLLGALGDVEWGPQQWKGGRWKGSKGVVGRSSGAGSWKGGALGAGEERQTTGLTSECIISRAPHKNTSKGGRTRFILRLG